jgi:hypothetical protein
MKGMVMTSKAPQRKLTGEIDIVHSRQMYPLARSIHSRSRLPFWKVGTLEAKRTESECYQRGPLPVDVNKVS